jgi:hypothetical protein
MDNPTSRSGPDKRVPPTDTNWRGTPVVPAETGLILKRFAVDFISMFSQGGLQEAAPPEYQ